jgi:hypothetical protein
MVLVLDSGGLGCRRGRLWLRLGAADKVSQGTLQLAVEYHVEG